MQNLDPSSGIRPAALWGAGLVALLAVGPSLWAQPGGSEADRARRDFERAMRGEASTSAPRSSRVDAATLKRWRLQGEVIDREIERQRAALREGGRTADDARVRYEYKSDIGEGTAVDHYLAGHMAAISEDLEGAAIYFQRALEEDPKLWWAHRGLGTCNARKGLHDAAREHYRKALALQPSDTATRLNLGVSLFELGRRIQAITTLKAAYVQDPGDKEVALTLSRMLAQMNENREAVALAKAAFRRDRKDPELALYLIRLLMSTDQSADAERVAQDWIAADPTSVLARINLAQVVQSLGRNRDAAEALSGVLPLLSDDQTEQRTKLQAEIRRLEALPERDSTERPPTMREIIGMLGGLEQARTRKALRYLKSIPYLKPGDARSQEIRGKVLSLLNNQAFRNEPKIVVPALDLLEQWYWGTAMMGQDNFVDILATLAAMQHRDPLIRGKAANMLGKGGQRRAVPLLMGIMLNPDSVKGSSYLFERIHQALNALTLAYIEVLPPERADLRWMDDTRKQWREWWQRNERRYR